MNPKAKIIATIGPASQSPESLRRLILEGIDVARLNFSHGTHDDHLERIKNIRAISEELHKPVSILQDLQGPKLRVGNLPSQGVEIIPGQIIYLCNEDAASTIKLDKDVLIIPMDVPDLTKSLLPGNRILMDDGNLEIEVINIDEDFIAARVVIGGVLKSHKGVNLPGANVNIPPLTPKDLEDLEFGLKNGVDYIAISFVKTAADIIHARSLIDGKLQKGKYVPIIAKLERPEAIASMAEILDAADGVMVARGDLAVETSPALVPIYQKGIIREANLKNKIVITATQMLESMINNPRPTRAEASDVANAIFDGTDAVMLSAETASGNYPIETVCMMRKIILEAESHFCDWSICIASDEPTKDDAVSITRASRELAHDRNVAAIAVFTQTGKTALLMAKARPQVPILAFTPNPDVYTRLNLYWGVTPFIVPFATSVEAMLTHVDTAIISSTSLKPGQQVVIISGFPVGQTKLPNFALLHTIGDQMVF